MPASDGSNVLPQKQTSFYHVVTKLDHLPCPEFNPHTGVSHTYGSHFVVLSCLGD